MFGVVHLFGTYSYHSTVKIPCRDCGEVFNRFCMPSHREFCLKRPYTCPYCRDWSATYQEVADEHWPDCELRPVACPNECGAQPSRPNLEEHVRVELRSAYLGANFCSETGSAQPHPTPLSPAPNTLSSAEKGVLASYRTSSSMRSLKHLSRI